MKGSVKFRNVLVSGCLVASVWLIVDSCVHEPYIKPSDPTVDVPPPVTPPGTIPDCNPTKLVCFESSVLPIFLSTCAKSGCHDATTHKEGYVLDSYTNIIKRGITPGSANNSKLYRVLAPGEDQMPPYPDLPLTTAQKDSIAKWINEGAKNTTNCNCSCDTTKFAYTADIKPILANSCVGCHNPNSLGGNIDLSVYDKVKVEATNGKLMGSITHTIGYSPMPKGGKLPDCEIKKIQKWVKAGALNN